MKTYEEIVEHLAEKGTYNHLILKEGLSTDFETISLIYDKNAHDLKEDVREKMEINVNNIKQKACKA